MGKLEVKDPVLKAIYELFDKTPNTFEQCTFMYLRYGDVAKCEAILNHYNNWVTVGPNKLDLWTFVTALYPMVPVSLDFIEIESE